MPRKNILLVAFYMLFFTGCNSQKVDEDVIVIIQPKLENNTTNKMKVLFKGLQLTDSICIENVDGLELNDYPSKKITELNGNKYLEYYTNIIPTKTGKINLPIVKGISDSVTLISEPKIVEVVDTLPNVTEDDIVLKLTSDKKKYSLNDTISITLYEYSKYYNVSKITTNTDNDFSIPKIEGKENELAIEMESDFYKVSGNATLEKYIEENFYLEEFDWDPFKDKTTMERLNDSLYLKNLLFSMKLTPKRKGKYKIKPSEFVYFVYKSETDYFDDFKPNGDGSYKVSRPKNKKLFSSNSLEFSVK